MIQANECRIGNWVNFYHSISGVTVQEQIYPEWFSNTADINDTYPIPLTPEILDKIGERKAVLGDSTIHWKIGDFLYSENCFHLSKGLHWLQNYHFFRTGEELTFKP